MFSCGLRQHAYLQAALLPYLQGHLVWNKTKHIMSGALSACFSRSCVAPLERIKLEVVLHRRQGEGIKQVARSIAHQEGWKGFWKGNLLNLLRTAPYKVPCPARQSLAVNTVDTEYRRNSFAYQYIMIAEIAVKAVVCSLVPAAPSQ